MDRRRRVELRKGTHPHSAQWEVLELAALSDTMVEMTFESVSDELYGLAPSEFTAARNARASEAREAGETALAASLKELRKPTVGAWLANLLARERAEGLEGLIALGRELRGGQHVADGDVIRRVSRQKQDEIATLVSAAKAMAANRGQSVSEAAAVDLEATLDAAFADPKAAESLRAGRLTAALHYSGFGIADNGETFPVRPSKDQRSAAVISAATRELELANQEAARADAEAEKAKRAVALAENDLKRLKASAAVAVRRATKAHNAASAAQKKVGR
jgi:hypothetical protein